MTRLISGICLFLTVINGAVAADGLDAWISAQEKLSLRLLLDNISPPGTERGAIVASPSRQRPDYFYHWIRDAGLVTSTLIDEYAASQGAAKADLATKIEGTLDFSLKLQKVRSPFGLGEPKFEVDGKVYTGAWARPQNDGPALRAIAFIKLARLWLSDGKTDLVRAKLYRAEPPDATLIKTDLEYISRHWQETSYDPWEETRGDHFYVRMVQRKALLWGAELADRLGDGLAARRYRADAAGLSQALGFHWDDKQQLILPTVHWDGGVDYKHSNLDVAVILAILHGDTDDGFFAPDDERVLATAGRLETAFKTLYAINDPAKGLPAVAIGRYPEDRYEGDPDNVTPQGKGNAWVLATAAFAELHFRIARAVERKGTVTLTPANRAFFSQLGVQTESCARKSSDPAAIQLPCPLRVGEVVRKLSQKGDAYLERLRYYGAGSGGHYSEQINRNTGAMQGAHDLTWNYASLLTAMQARAWAPR